MHKSSPNIKYLFSLLSLTIIFSATTDVAFAQGNSTNNKAVNTTPAKKPFVQPPVIKPSSPISSSVSSNLRWYNNFNQAINEARQGNKYVMVDMYTEWCGWCKRLDKDVYSNPDVIRFLNQGYVSLKLDAEKDRDGQQLASKYGINGYPCIMLFDSQGKYRGKFLGYKPANEFPQALEQLKSGGQ